MTKLQALFLVSTLLVVVCYGSPFALQNEIVKASPKAEINYRLPTSIKPSHYTVELTPYLEKVGPKEAFTFDGKVEITVSTDIENQSEIILHINNTIVLDETKTKVTDQDGKPVTFTTDYVGKITTDFYHIKLANPMVIGNNYRISFEYTGILHDDMRGFYRSSYVEDNVTKWIATTQFQPTHARKAFPCFDEPLFKATFDIIINRPKNMKTSLGNMEVKATTSISADRDQDVFYTTPKMSTYLVAFIISDFESISNSIQKFGVWARPNAINQGLYSFEVGLPILRKLEEFTGIKYVIPEAPNMKMDLVALPDFSAGAMENWGLLTFRETALLYDADVSTALAQQRVATVVAHEQAHMWFGDLVTCEWWADAWLNEGFARYLQYFGTAKHITDWNLPEQFVVEQLQNVFAMDALLSSHAMSTSVGSPVSISAHFDSIIYNKGASVIRMMEHTITTKTFVAALNRYLNARRLSTAVPDDLFSAVQDQVNEDKTLENVNIAEFMKTWTEQMGYPVITVTQGSGKLTVKQERFLLQKSLEAPVLSWHVPLTYTSKSEKMFQNTQPREWLPKGTTEIEITTTNKEHEWVIFNLNQTGYYRVNYDQHTWELISDALHSDNFDEIPELNRAQIVDDTFNLARANRVTYDFALKLLDYLKTETNYLSWYAAFNGFSYINQRLSGDSLKLFQDELLGLMSHLYEKLGFEHKATDSRVDIYNRAQTLTWACALGHEDCVAKAKEEFDAWVQNGTRISPDVRPAVYCTALRNGDKDKWETLWKKYESENVAAEQVLILSALGCTKDKEIINEYLEKSVTEGSGIRKQDAASVFSAVYAGNRENVQLAFTFLKNNYKKISASYGGMNALGSSIKGIASRLATQQEVTELEEFLNEHADEMEDVASTAASAIEAAKSNLEWSKSYSTVIEKYITEKNNGYVPTGSVTVMCVLLIGVFWF